ncbi:hypothetical protein COO60DRAFT_586329 [Scenedesmus sp. NREL 46B-D3]|nr:hypothetical protein COO60DRAFT_586329 [Scenedesmus sp. NREL 46B-D3]
MSPGLDRLPGSQTTQQAGSGSWCMTCRRARGVLQGAGAVKGAPGWLGVRHRRQHHSRHNPWDTLPSGPGLWDLEVRLTSSTQQIGVPSYYYPCFTNTASCHWSRTSGSAATRLAIINPASGPGSAVDSNYVTMVNNMKAAGLIVLAYTYTAMGQGQQQQYRPTLTSE